MTEKCETKWSPTEDQIDNIIIPAMQGTAQQYSKYASELQFPPAFLALMLRDIADTFEENLNFLFTSCLVPRFATCFLFLFFFSVSTVMKY